MLSFTIVGNLGRDAELTNLSGGGSVISFSVAVNRKIKEREDQVTFLNCSYYLKDGSNLIRYLGKGSKIALSGSWYVNKKASNGNYYQSFYIDRLELIDSREATGLSSGSNNPVRASKHEEDPPF